MTNTFITFVEFTAHQIIGVIGNANTSNLNIAQLIMQNSQIESQTGHGGLLGGLILNSTLTGQQITIEHVEITQANELGKQYSGLCVGALQQSQLTLTNSQFAVTQPLDDKSFAIFGQTQTGSINTLSTTFNGVTFAPLIFKKCVGACINNIGVEMPVICNEADLNGIDFATTPVCESNIL
ncbi:Hypothetical_protein [Hexamita inflata]|uniref:Hypothetical_protein n=1 Tax=Hexamita inflata TaxID=28002 RepID=A0AA86P2U9_9EUKA|nr:Hypothetical protein HINF_LOCUS19137 [Hexamita inflata]